MRKIYGITLCLLLVALAGTALATESAHHYVVTLSYYGDDFNINPQSLEEHKLGPGDTVTYRTGDPGVLILRLDDGTVYYSGMGSITFTARQLAHTKKVRCSMLTDDGNLIGWEVNHEDRYGGNTPGPED
jgi:hypothetical protein